VKKKEKRKKKENQDEQGALSHQRANETSLKSKE